MKRFVVYLLVIFFALSTSAPQANSAVTPGTKCVKVGVKQDYQGKTYTCVKSGNKLVWSKGKELKPVSKTVKPVKEIDYSSCMEERVYVLYLNIAMLLRILVKHIRRDLIITQKPNLVMTN